MTLSLQIGSQMGHRNSKGTVAVTRYRNTIRLRWRYAGKRYSFNLFTYTKSNLIEAKKIAISIEDDMMKNAFDSTLCKYRNQHQSSAAVKVISFHHSSIGSIHSTSNHLPQTEDRKGHEGNFLSSPASLVKTFEEWAQIFKNKDCSTHIKYHAIWSMLKKWGDIEPKQIVYRLSNEAFAPRTYNERLRILSQFLDYLVLEGSIEVNLLKAAQPRPVGRVKIPERQPFTNDEITKILKAFKHDTCCRCTNYRHSYYYPFIYFIFKTGVRNAEAIGLRVQHLDFKNKVVEIKETLSRTVKGGYSAARVRKETKNGKERKLPMDKELMAILKAQVKGKQADDLVFPSPKGKAIDDRMFQKRIFKEVLKELEIPMRVLYACRHTFNSRCLESGMNPVTTAFLMGNNPETALKYYTHLINLPDSLPQIKS